MAGNSPSHTPEAQKFIQAKELHDDKKLESDVQKFSSLIAAGKSQELKDSFKNYRVEGIGNFENALLRLDLQNRPKDGRVIGPLHDGDDAAPALIKNKSNLAKIIQLYIIAFDASVQKTDFAKSLVGVDGNLERFTMQGLTQIIQGIRNRIATDNLRNEIDQKMRSGPLKAMGSDIDTKVRNHGDTNEDLRSKRNMSVDLIGDALKIGSYNQQSTIDLTTGKISFGGLLTSREYPTTVHLVRDRDNKQNPVFIESEVNRTNIKNAMNLINLVHFVVSEFMNEKRKGSMRDGERPFYISNGNLLVNDSLINDTDIAKRETLRTLLTDARTNTYQDPEILARFLNDIFRSFNPQKTIDRGSTHVGAQKPISSQP